MKMKKVLAVMLTTAAVLATSACGSSAPAEAPAQETTTEAMKRIMPSMLLQRSLSQLTEVLFW